MRARQQREFQRAYRERTGRGYGWDRYRDQRRANNRARSAARRGAPPADRFTDLEVFERDRWRCGICGGRIARRREYPDPLAPSIDHVVPITEGGEHTLANVRAAHLRCNVARRDRGGGEQLRLIG